MGIPSKKAFNLVNLLTFALLILVFVFWPVSFLLKNSTADYIRYFLPNIILLISFVLYLRQKDYWMYPLLLVPIINSQLIIFPLIIGIYVFIQNYKSKLNWLFLSLSLIILLVGFKSFYSGSVFNPEHFDQQKIIMKANLYPQIFPAKILQNSLSAPWISFKENFFILIDPNNYFFGLHPREKVDYQNLYKFSFVYMIFFLVGIYYILNFKYFKFVLILLGSLIINLSFLKNLNQVESLLFLPISLIIAFGIFYIAKLINRKLFLIATLGIVLIIVILDFSKLLLIK